MTSTSEKTTSQRELCRLIRSTFPATDHSIVMRKPAFGVGINDADYVTMPKLNGRFTRCPAYRSWHNMIRRANDPKLHEKHPSYSDVQVCESWIRFMSFRNWWLENQVDFWDLEKDILSTDKTIYSPETCIFVPRWINLIIVDCASSRGDFPIGVSWHKRDKTFQSHCKDPLTAKVRYIGSFQSPELAYAAWLDRKLEQIKSLKDLMDDVDSRIYPRIVSIIKSL